MLNVEKIRIGLLYRPPSALADYWNLFYSNFEKVAQCELVVFFLGDFNVNVLIDQGTNFLQMVQRLGFDNLIHDVINFTISISNCIV